MPPFSSSRVNARFNASTPMKAYATHSSPGATGSKLPGDRFSPKLNTTTTISPNTNADAITSRDRNSSRTSFHATVSAPRSQFHGLDAPGSDSPVPLPTRHHQPLCPAMNQYPPVLA